MASRISRSVGRGFFRVITILPGPRRWSVSSSAALVSVSRAPVPARSALLSGSDHALDLVGRQLHLPRSLAQLLENAEHATIAPQRRVVAIAVVRRRQLGVLVLVLDVAVVPELFRLLVAVEATEL